MDTATVTVMICRCGWVSVAPSFGVSVEMYDQHSQEEGSHSINDLAGVANPMEPELIRYFTRKASVLANESRALDNLENWKEKPELPRVYDDGLGAFRGMWNVLKGWMVVGAIALVCYGVWKLS